MPRPGTFRFKLPDALDWEANRVRLHVDASRSQGRNRIDTVKLIGEGDGGSQWPTSAKLIGTDR